MTSELARPALELRTGPDAGSERANPLDLDRRVFDLLVGRGVVDPEAQARLLDPRLAQLRKPVAMAGFEPARDLLADALERGTRIGIFGDYDVDGVTTATILSTFLEALGGDVVCRVAERDAGYGFGVAAAREFHECGCGLVLTGDCGTSDIEAISWLKERGIPVAVIDHHQAPEVMPPTAALLNPHQPGCKFPFKGLCSAGVAFYLCAALRTEMGRRRAGSRLPDPRAWLDLVALGTVCDMVPMVEENRVLTHHGLEFMQQRRRPGIRALLERARVGSEVRLDESHLGFTLGPRLNAPGRLSGAEPSLSLLRARSDADAAGFAAEVEMFNTRRREAQRRIAAEAAAILAADPATEGRSGIVVAHQGWEAGVVGIAANGIVDRYRRPTLVLALDSRAGEARGSARSYGDIDVRAALAECEPILTRFGGHKAAAGVSLPVDKVPELVEAFDAAVAKQVSDGDRLGDPRLVHDGVLELVEVNRELLAQLDRVRPFGVGFDPPQYVCEDARVVSVRRIKNEHLALSLAQSGATLEGMLFGGAALPIERGDVIGAAFTPQLRSWGGRTQVELRLETLWSGSVN